MIMSITQKIKHLLSTLDLFIESKQILQKIADSTDSISIQDTAST